MILRLETFTCFPMTRVDAERMLSKLDVASIVAVDFTRIKAVSHCFSDELFTRIGHDVQILNASEFVHRIAKVTHDAASKERA